MLKVCLLNPPFEKQHNSTSVLGWPSPSISYLGGAVHAAGHQIDLIDGKLENLGLNSTLQRIAEISPDVLGITACTTDMPMVRRITKTVREKLPDINIILGGAHASASPELTLDSNCDALVIGEGEITFVELLESIEKKEDFSSVSGCAFKQGGRIVVTPARVPEKDLDGFPMPVWEKMPRASKYYIQVSRGCPGDCSFCYRTFGKRIRVRHPALIVEEIQNLLHYTEIDELILGAATFGLPKKHSNALLDALIKSGLNKKIRWQAVTRVDTGDPAFFSKMKQAGCYLVGLGIESGSNRILKATGKHTTKEKISDSVRAIKTAKLDSTGFFVLGHPWETKETAKQTSDFAIQLNPTYMTIGIMTPWPGTSVHQLALENQAGYRLNPTIPLEGQNKHFGKRALEFKDINILYLQWLRMRTYLLLYLRNRRYMDGIRFTLKYFREASVLLKETLLLVLRK